MDHILTLLLYELEKKYWASPQSSGVRTVLVGKTHVIADKEGMDRLGVDPSSAIGVPHSPKQDLEPLERELMVCQFLMQMVKPRV